MRSPGIAAIIVLTFPTGPEPARATEPTIRAIPGALICRTPDDQPGVGPRDRAILAKLDIPISLRYPKGATLRRVVSDIKRAIKGPNDASIPVHVAPDGLKRGDKTMSSPVTMELKGVPLRTTLRLLLAQLGMGFYVEDGLLIISDQDSVEGDHP